MSIILASIWLGKNETGKTLHITDDMPIFPPEFDAKAESLSLNRNCVPAFCFDRPNFKGAQLILSHGGGCDDLSTMPGNWMNRIRSIKFAHKDVMRGIDSAKAAAEA
jgi:hypothetical protein